VLARNEGLFTREESDFARDPTNRLTDLRTTATETVPCHGDYYFHNWLVDATGTVRIIDFDESRWDRRRLRLLAAVLPGVVGASRPRRAVLRRVRPAARRA